MSFFISSFISKSDFLRPLGETGAGGEPVVVGVAFLGSIGCSPDTIPTVGKDDGGE